MVVVTTEAEGPTPRVKVTVESSTVVLISRDSLDVTVLVNLLQSDHIASLVVTAASTSRLWVVVEVGDVQSAHVSSLSAAVAGVEVVSAAGDSVFVTVSVVVVVDVETSSAATSALVVEVDSDQSDQSATLVVVVVVAVLVDAASTKPGVVVMLIAMSSTVELDVVVSGQSGQAVSLLYVRLYSMPSGRACAKVMETTTSVRILNCIVLFGSAAVFVRFVCVLDPIKLSLSVYGRINLRERMSSVAKKE